MSDELQNQNVNWDDDSGEIHTVSKRYYTTAQDGWQDNHALSGLNKNGSDRRKIKGKQIGFQYVTDDYRKVLPGYIIATVVIVAFCIIAFLIHPIAGIGVTAFGAVWIVGFWKNAPSKSGRIKQKS